MVAAGLLAIVVVAAAAATEKVVENVSVVDGNTLQIGDKVSDLYGIDAPELGQLCFQDGRWNHCGITAAFELKKLLDFDKPLRCEPAPADKLQIVCHAASVDVALVLLKGGYVVAKPGSEVAYGQAEKSAREGNLGLWHMSFVMPSDWRQGKRLLGAAEADEAAPCPIRGVIDERGRKIYYVPTDPAYKKAVVDTEKGERLFCSDVAARQAGWLRPGEHRKSK